MCPECDEFAANLEIHGPAQLRRIVDKLQDAVSARKLRPDDSRSPPALGPQVHFAELDLSTTLPDAMIYYLTCCSCGRAFQLQCDCYHGAGGSWRSV